MLHCKTVNIIATSNVHSARCSNSLYQPRIHWTKASVAYPNHISLSCHKNAHHFTSILKSCQVAKISEWIHFKVITKTQVHISMRTHDPANHLSLPASGSSIIPWTFHWRLKCHLLKNWNTDSSTPPPFPFHPKWQPPYQPLANRPG